MQLAKAYPSFVELDAEVIAVGPDPAEAFRELFARLRLPFPGIPDPEHGIADTYGQEVTWWKLGRMPAQFLIDKRGVVRFAEYSRSMSQITPPREILQFLRRFT